MSDFNLNKKIHTNKLAALEIKQNAEDSAPEKFTIYYLIKLMLKKVIDSQ